MSYQVNEKELAAVVSLPLETRYGYFLGKVADWDELWSLGDEAGWALCGDSVGRILVPVWPAKAFASICATGEWSLYSPKSITLDDWLEKWTPGMIADGRSVAVFPVVGKSKNKSAGETGILVEPTQLSDDLVEILKQFG